MPRSTESQSPTELKSQDLLETATGISFDEALLALRECANITGHLALYCDRTEHNEDRDTEAVRDAGQRLRRLALVLAGNASESLIELYARRLLEIEGKFPASGPESPRPAREIRGARSWNQLQYIQAEHDRYYHPDVFGLSKLEQLHHYTLHLAKLTRHVSLLLDSDTADWAAFAERRLPDLLLFGMKLATVSGQQLHGAPDPDFELARASSRRTRKELAAPAFAGS